MVRNQKIQLILFVLFFDVVCCVPLTQFYSYGPIAKEVTNKISKGNDAFSSEIFMKIPLYFYDQLCESVIVSFNQ